MIYYNKFLEFITKHKLLDKKSFVFISNHTKNIDYENNNNEIGYTYSKNKEGKIVSFKICVPTIINEKTLIINIRNYIYALLLYDMLGKQEDIGEKQHAIALLFERLYVLENEFLSVKTYNKELTEEINEINNEEFSKGAKIASELLIDHENNIFALNKKLNRNNKK